MAKFKIEIPDQLKESKYFVYVNKVESKIGNRFLVIKMSVSSLVVHDHPLYVKRERIKEAKSRRIGYAFIVTKLH